MGKHTEKVARKAKLEIERLIDIITISNQIDDIEVAAEDIIEISENVLSYIEDICNEFSLEVSGTNVYERYD